MYAIGKDNFGGVRRTVCEELPDLVGRDLYNCRPLLDPRNVTVKVDCE